MTPVAVRLDGEPCGPGWWAVPSRTFPGESWRVYYQRADLMHCFCPVFTRRQQCRHTEAVALAVEVEARQPSTPERRAHAARRLEAIAEEMSL